MSADEYRDHAERRRRGERESARWTAAYAVSVAALVVVAVLMLASAWL